MDNEIQIDDLDTKMAKKNLKKLTAYMKPYWTWIIISLLLTFITSMVAIWTPTLIGDMVDEVVYGMTPEIDEEEFMIALIEKGVNLEAIMSQFEGYEEPTQHQIMEALDYAGIDIEYLVEGLDTSDRN